MRIARPILRIESEKWGGGGCSVRSIWRIYIYIYYIGLSVDKKVAIASRVHKTWPPIGPAQHENSIQSCNPPLK